MKSLVIFGSIFIGYAIGCCEAKAAAAQAFKTPQNQFHNLESTFSSGWVVEQSTIWAVADGAIVFIGFQFLVFATLAVLDFSLARNLFIRSGLSPPCFS